MPDVFSPEKRSWMMSRIRSTNTRAEIAMKKILSELEYEHEMHVSITGKPDFVIKSHKIAIFCDGDFWHGYKYHEKKKPGKKYWKEKIMSNMKRDLRVNRELRSNGWSVLRFWEHDIHNNPEKCKRRIVRKISEMSLP